MDEIAFKAGYGEWKASERLEAAGETGPGEALLVLARIREAVSAEAFRLSGVDLARVSAEAKRVAAGMPPDCHSIARALSSLKPSGFKALVASSVKEGRLAPLAEACFYNSLLSELDFDFVVSADLVERAYPAVKGMKTAGPGPSDGDGIAFSAKYGDWISIKKMSIDGKVPAYEVAAMLASIRETVDKKAFQLAGVKTDLVEARAAALAKGRRKALGSLAELFSSMNAGDMQAFFATAVAEPKNANFAEACFFKALSSAIGFDFEVRLETLKKIHPDLKTPMPKGRKPKK